MSDQGSLIDLCDDSSSSGDERPSSPHDSKEKAIVIDGSDDDEDNSSDNPGGNAANLNPRRNGSECTATPGGNDDDSVDYSQLPRYYVVYNPPCNDDEEMRENSDEELAAVDADMKQSSTPISSAVAETEEKQGSDSTPQPFAPLLPTPSGVDPPSLSRTTAYNASKYPPTWVPRKDKREECDERFSVSDPDDDKLSDEEEEVGVSSVSSADETSSSFVHTLGRCCFLHASSESSRHITIVVGDEAHVYELSNRGHLARIQELFDDGVLDFCIFCPHDIDSAIDWGRSRAGRCLVIDTKDVDRRELVVDPLLVKHAKNVKMINSGSGSKRKISILSPLGVDKLRKIASLRVGTVTARVSSEDGGIVSATNGCASLASGGTTTTSSSAEREEEDATMAADPPSDVDSTNDDGDHGTKKRKDRSTIDGRGPEHQSSKRRRLEDYADYISEQFYKNVEAERARRQARHSSSSSYDPPSGVSFGSIYPRPLNEKQQAVRSSHLDFAVGAFQYVLKRGHAITPGSFMWKLIERGCTFSMEDDTNDHIYLEEVSNKGGMACKGTTRTKAYLKKWNKRKKKNPALRRPKLTSIISIGSMSEHLQRELTPMLLDGISRFTFKTPPSTVGEALALDMEGLPYATQSFFHDVINKDAISVRGFLPVIYRNTLESGFQENEERRGSPVKGSLHESTSGNWFGCYLAKEKEKREATRQLFLCKAFSPTQQEMMMEEQVETAAESTWPPGSIPGSKNEELTPKILGMTFGSNWRDSQPNPPVAIPKNSDQCYNASKYYTMSQKRWAMNRKDGTLLAAALFGGAYAIDEDEVNMEARGGMPMVDYILQLRPFGPDGPVWKVAFTYLKVTVLFLDYEWVNLVHLLFVHGAPCHMGQSHVKVNYSWHMIDTMAVTALSWQFIHDCMKLLSTPNASLDVLDESILDIDLKNNFWFHFVTSGHARKNFHLYHKASTLKFKNDLDGGETNLYEEGNNGLRRTAGAAGDENLVARNARANLSRQSDDKVSRDNLLRRVAVSSTFNASTKEEAADIMVNAVDSDISGDGRKVNRSMSYERYVSLKNARDMIKDDEIWDLFEAKYKSTRDNTGNTTNHRTATKNEKKETDIKLVKFADSLEDFFCQAAGTAGDKPKRSAKDALGNIPFVLPPDGVLRFKAIGGGMKEVAFDSSKFVSISLASLRDRCYKKTNGEGKTNADKVARFPTKTVKWDKDMAKCVGGGAKEWNESNVVRVWFEDNEED